MPQPVYNTVGGFETNAVASGAVAPLVIRSGGDAQVYIVGSDIMFQSGPGRLNHIIPHQTVMALSGVQATFYDAAAPVSGGPVLASGHILLGGLAAGYGVSGQILGAGIPIPINVPFTSGLCLNSRSGQPGMTVVWTAEKLPR